FAGRERDGRAGERRREGNRIVSAVDVGPGDGLPERTGSVVAIVGDHECRGVRGGDGRGENRGERGAAFPDSEAHGKTCGVVDLTSVFIGETSGALTEELPAG